MAFPKLALLLALAVGANAADDQIVVGQTFMAGAVAPTSGSTGWALTSHGISEKLFTVDKDGNIVGQVADSVERVSDNVWEVTLKDGYKFSDGTDVTAQAVADALTELNTVDPNGAGMASVGTMTVTAPKPAAVDISPSAAPSYLLLRSGLPRKNSSSDSSRNLTSDTNSKTVGHLAARDTSKHSLGRQICLWPLGAALAQIHALVAAQRATTTGQPR